MLDKNSQIFRDWSWEALKKKKKNETFILKFLCIGNFSSLNTLMITSYSEGDVGPSKEHAFKGSNIDNIAPSFAEENYSLLLL